MKILIYIFLYILTTFSYAQNQKGIVSYRAELSLEQRDEFISEAKENKNLSMDTKQRIIDITKNVKPDFYELNFSGNESYYFFDKDLESPNNSYLNSKAGRNPFYINLSSNTIIEDSRIFGFVSQKHLDWKITNEAKTIGKFKCYKAITTETLYSRQGHYYDREVVAWFTPEIPVSFGPKNYVGLPGLVLKVKRKEFTITAIKIDLNPDGDKLKIKRVGEDENVISQKEMDERIAEMMEDYNKR